MSTSVRLPRAWAILLGVFAFAVAVGSAAPGMAAQIMVVIDASGSAAGRIGDVRKIDIARAALEATLRDAPLDLSLGAVAYGHRDRESCTDVELLAAPGPADDALAAATTIAPLGRSPIAEATVAAAEALGGPEVEGTVVVITDNADNCAPDPCDVIADLHERMPNITVSIVGIAIPPEEVAAIACFAELTGGTYTRADDANRFRENLADVLTEAWAEPVIPLPTANLTIEGPAVQGQPFTVAYDGPLLPGDQIRISWFGTPGADHIVGADIHADGTAVTMTAPMERGAYELRYWHAERRAVLATARLQVEAIAPTITAPATVQQGATFEVVWSADAHGGETIQLADPGALVDQPLVMAEARRTQPLVTMVAPTQVGEFELRLVLPAAAPVQGVAMSGAATDRIIARQPIRVVPANAAITAPPTVAAGQPFSVGWMGPGGPDDDIYLAAATAPAALYIDAQRPRQAELTFHAPYAAGEYELRYWSGALGRVIGKAAFTVTMPTATLDAPATAAGGQPIEVVWTGPGGFGDRVVIVDPADATQPLATTIATTSGRPATLIAPIAAGDYEIRYLAGPDGLVLARQALEVRATTVALMPPEQVVAGEPFVAEWEGPGAPLDEIRLIAVSDDGRRPLAAVRVTEGEPARLAAPEIPGPYTLVYWSGAESRALISVTIEVICDPCAAAPVSGGPAQEPPPGPPPAAPTPAG